MATQAASSAEELQMALDVNRTRLASASAYLDRLAKAEDWQGWGETMQTIDMLLDERNALRARR